MQWLLPTRIIASPRLAVCYDAPGEDSKMVETHSTMLPLGTQAPQFRLPDPSGQLVSSDSFSDAPALLVVFMCNHCPFVRHIRSRLAELAKDYQQRGVAVVGINANDANNYPE